MLYIKWKRKLKTILGSVWLQVLTHFGFLPDELKPKLKVIVPYFALFKKKKLCSQLALYFAKYSLFDGHNF